MMYYTYLHRRASDNSPFYIGKGKGDRAHRTNHRNPYWHRTVKKHGLQVEILAHWPTEAEAFEHEKFLIWCFKDMGVELVNLSDGGEGQSGYKHTAETKQKLREANIGREQSEESRSKTAKRMTGNQYWAGRTHAEEAKAKISAGNKGKLAGPRSPRYGKPIPESQKLAISRATSGSNHRLAKKVMCIETGAVYDTCTDAAIAMTGGKNSRSSISKAALGKVKRLYGFTWKYV